MPISTCTYISTYIHSYTHAYIHIYIATSVLTGLAFTKYEIVKTMYTHLN